MKNSKDTIISNLEIDLMGLKEQLRDINKTIKYIYEKGLVKEHGAGILHQTIEKQIEQSKYFLNLKELNSSELLKAEVEAECFFNEYYSMIPKESRNFNYYCKDAFINGYLIALKKQKKSAGKV